MTIYEEIKRDAYFEAWNSAAGFSEDTKDPLCVESWKKYESDLEDYDPRSLEEKAINNYLEKTGAKSFIIDSISNIKVLEIYQEAWIKSGGLVWDDDGENPSPWWHACCECHKEEFPMSSEKLAALAAQDWKDSRQEYLDMLIEVKEDFEEKKEEEEEKDSLYRDDTAIKDYKEKLKEIRVVLTDIKSQIAAAEEQKN